MGEVLRAGNAENVFHLPTCCLDSVRPCAIEVGAAKSRALRVDQEGLDAVSLES